MNTNEERLLKAIADLDKNFLGQFRF